MKTYIIYPICTGIFTDAEKSNFIYQKNQGIKIKAPILMYLIKGDDSCILVDTGCCDEKWALKYHHALIQTEDMKPVNALKKLGINAKDIKTIINTHLHWDHCFNNDKFPNANIYIQKREIQFAVSPIPTQDNYYESSNLHMTPPWTKAFSNIKIIDGDYDIADGIKILLTPGHTPGFQSISVNTSDGIFLIVSDCFGISDAWSKEQTGGLPTPSGIHVNLLEYYDSIKRLYPMVKDDKHILCGHDAKVLEHNQYPF